jgi:hypothetical protein
MRCLVVLLLLLPAAFAQFPGLGSIKDKIDHVTRKTAPVTDRAQRAVDTFTPWTPEEEQQFGQAAAEKLVGVPLRYGRWASSITGPVNYRVGLFVRVPRRIEWPTG